MKKALIFWGGWDGHDPEGCAKIFTEELTKRGYEVTCENHMESLEDAEKIKKFDVIIPIWTMGELTADASKNLLEVVKNGTAGFAGFHGGTGDAFRGNLDYEWMTGGHFVGHPYVGKYTIELTGESTITGCLPKSFEYDSEQYYMMIDPAINTLATTQYDHQGQKVTMPVIWTSQYGEGKVFYSALGHVAEEFKKYPEVLEMTLRGIEWASG